MAWREAQRGAATVEVAGVTVAVAVLAFALGPLLARSARVDERPPPVLSRLAAPVSPIEGAPYVDLDQRLPPWPRYAASSGIVDRSIGAAWAGAVGWSEFSLDAQEAFNDGFERCLVQELRSYWDDPVGTLAPQLIPAPVGVPRPRPDTRHPRPERGVGESGLDALRPPDVESIARDWFESYRDKLRDKPPRDVALTVSREAGCLAFDVALTRGRGLAKKAARDAIRKRMERRAAQVTR